MTDDDEQGGQRLRAFVLMPFSPDFDAIYQRIVKPSLESAGFTVMRADEFTQAHRNILADILEGIQTADLVIAEVSTLNPNVMYELGVAHTLGRPTVLLSQENGELPFDLRSYRALIYSTSFFEIEESLGKRLVAVGEAIQSGDAEFSNPVLDYLDVAAKSSKLVADDADAPDRLFDPPKAPDEEGEKGLWDSIADQQARIVEMTADAQLLAELVAGIGEATEQRSAELDTIMLRPASQRSAAMLRVMNALAADLDEFADNLLPVGESLEQRLMEVGDDSINIIKLGDWKSDENFEAFDEMIEGIDSAVRSMEEAEGGIESMAGSMRTLRTSNFSRKLTRSLSRAISSTERVLGALETGKSSLGKVVEQWKLVKEARQARSS